MNKTRAIPIVAMFSMFFMVLGAADLALGDGMIVPIRPDIRVRGSWAVKYHHVNVLVRDQVAAVSVDQAFVNTGKGMIEVEYLFPVPPGAAIDSMTLVVDGKEFAAKLLKADEARKIYEDIVRRKKDPALLEYVGFGLYKTRAFPLMPGKPCKVIVTYKSICRKDQDLVEVWYPLNTEKYSARAIDSVRVRVDIKSKADIGPVYSPTHSLNVKRKAPNHVIGTYEVKKALPTTDFQLFYKSANEKIGASLVTHQGDPKTDGHFMMLVSPNPRNARTAVAAKNVIAVFDHSGSMSDKKIAQAKEALKFVLKNLNPEDNFNVVSYNDSVETFFATMVTANKEK
ncbi:MAG: VWA domain-containing protein, partial [bacterium]|nr:VWA domain-containing protein [bacterium]